MKIELFLNEHRDLVCSILDIALIDYSIFDKKLSQKGLDLLITDIDNFSDDLFILANKILCIIPKVIKENKLEAFYKDKLFFMPLPVTFDSLVEQIDILSKER